MPISPIKKVILYLLGAVMISAIIFSIGVLLWLGLRGFFIRFSRGKRSKILQAYAKALGLEFSPTPQDQEQTLGSIYNFVTPEGANEKIANIMYLELPEKVTLTIFDHQYDVEGRRGPAWTNCDSICLI
jgi:hypothetical protein